MLFISNKSAAIAPPSALSNRRLRALLLTALLFLSQTTVSPAHCLAENHWGGSMRKFSAIELPYKLNIYYLFVLLLSVCPLLPLSSCLCRLLSFCHLFGRTPHQIPSHLWYNDKVHSSIHKEGGFRTYLQIQHMGVNFICFAESFRAWYLGLLRHVADKFMAPVCVVDIHLVLVWTQVFKTPWNYMVVHKLCNKGGVQQRVFRPLRPVPPRWLQWLECQNTRQCHTAVWQRAMWKTFPVWKAERQVFSWDERKMSQRL